MKKSIGLYIIILISLIITSCAVPSEPPAESQPSPADTIMVTDALIESITLQPEPITEAPTEPVTDSPAEPIVLCQNEQYTITVVNGNCYINFADGNAPAYNAVGDAPPEIGIPPEELTLGLYYQTLNDYQLTRIKCVQPRGKNGVYLPEYILLFWPDTEAVSGLLSSTTGQLRLTYPSDLSDGGTYTPGIDLVAQLSRGTDSVGYIRLIANSDEGILSYNTLYDRDFKDYKNRNVTITHEESGAYLGYPCQIAEYHGETESYRDIYITFIDDSRDIEIEISYCLEDTANTGLRPVSDTVPWRVLIFGKENERYFYAYLYNFTEAPSIAWLSTFGYDWVPDSSDHVAS